MPNRTLALALLGHAPDPIALIVDHDTLIFANGQARGILVQGEPARLRDGIADRCHAARIGEPVRISIPAEGTLRITAERVTGEVLALSGRFEAPRSGVLFERLIGQGLTAADARIALRVVEGWSTPQIASAFGIGQPAARVRLHRLYRKLGLTSREQLRALLHDRDTRAIVPAASASVVTGNAGFALPRLAELCIAGRAEGLVCLEQGDLGHIVLGNAHGRELLTRIAADPHAATAWSVLIGRLAHETLARERLFAGGEALRVAVFRVAAGAIGCHLRRESIRLDDLLLALRAEVAIPPRELAIAEATLRGTTSRETAELLGVAPGTVRSLRARLFVRFGVQSLEELRAKAMTLAERSCGRPPVETNATISQRATRGIVDGEPSRDL